MSNMDWLRSVYGDLNEGEKIYLANKLWKEDKIVAQKIREFVPESLLPSPLKYKRGDTVILSCMVTVIDVDPSEAFPYLVETTDGGCLWVDADFIKQEEQ